MRLWHPRVFAKFALSRITLLPNYCKRCGRDAEPFHVPYHVWQDIVGDGGRDERCIRCFTAEAADHGHHVEWRVA